MRTCLLKKQEDDLQNSNVGDFVMIVNANRLTLITNKTYFGRIPFYGDTLAKTFISLDCLSQTPHLCLNTNLYDSVHPRNILRGYAGKKRLFR